MHGHRLTLANRNGLQSVDPLTAQTWAYLVAWYYARPMQPGQAGSLVALTTRDAKTKLADLLGGLDCLTNGFAKILDLNDNGRVIAHYAGTPAQVIDVLTTATTYLRPAVNY